MIASSNSSKKCIYCFSRDVETRDHVRPRSFFPKPRPSDLITVPSCGQCNSGAGKDEEFFLATFMFGPAGGTRVGKRLWDQKIRRALGKNLGLRRRIAGNLHPVEVHSPYGLFIRKGMGIQLENERHLRIIRMITRGLYYFEFGEPLDPSVDIQSHFAQLSSEMAPIRPVMDQLRMGSRQWPGVFEYRFNRVEEKPDASIWVLMLYGVNVFWAISNDEELHEEPDLHSGAV